MSSGSDLGTQCQICGHTNPDVLETHHKLPQRHGGPDDPENLVSLCGSCHNAIERIYDDGFFQQLFDQVGYEVEKSDADTLGREVDAHLSPDREFPDDPVHATTENITSDDGLRLVDAGVFSWEELERGGYTSLMEGEDWEEYKERAKQEDLDKHGEVTEQTEAEIERLEDADPRLRYWDALTVIHCGYCNRLFAEWERADAARHLTVAHGVDDPYLQESDNISEWEKEKRKLKAKHAGDSVLNAGFGVLEQGIRAEPFEEKIEEIKEKRRKERQSEARTAGRVSKNGE